MKKTQLHSFFLRLKGKLRLAQLRRVCAKLHYP